MGFPNKTLKCLVLYALNAELFPEFLLIFPEEKKSINYRKQERHVVKWK